MWTLTNGHQEEGGPGLLLESAGGWGDGDVVHVSDEIEGLV